MNKSCYYCQALTPNLGDDSPHYFCRFCSTKINGSVYTSYFEDCIKYTHLYITRKVNIHIRMNIIYETTTIMMAYSSDTIELPGLVFNTDNIHNKLQTILTFL